VGGGVANRVYGAGSFIGAGGYLNSKVGDGSNFIAGNDAFIGAGDVNSIASNGAFIGGGLSNTISAGGTDAAIAGGDHNTAAGAYGAVAGGYHNNATATASAVGGGSSSSATGTYATIPGGYLNAARPSVASPRARKPRRVTTARSFGVIITARRRCSRPRLISSWLAPPVVSIPSVTARKPRA